MSDRKINSCSSTRKWADLPKELLEIIGGHLQSRIDVFRYRAICTSWRSAISLSNHHSSLSPRFTFPSSSSDDDVSPLLFPFTIFRLEDQHGNSACLVKVVETALGKLEILNPLTIPKSDFILGKTINLLECRLIELAKGYHISSHTSSHSCYNIQKAVIFRDCGILAIYDCGKLGFRKFGDENWTDLGSNLSRYHDILVYQEEYYVIDLWGITSCVDKFMNVVKCLPRHKSTAQRKNLVESNGRLYVVDTYYLEQDEEGEVNDRGYKGVNMKVYKLDEEWGTWIQVNCLYDRVFILGKEVCFSVSATDFPGCKGNCIYFIDYEYLEEDKPGYQYYEEEMEYSAAVLSRPPPWSIMGVAPSPSLVRHFDEGMGYYVTRAYKLDDWSIRDIAGSPSLNRLFSLPKSCVYSTLSFP